MTTADGPPSLAEPHPRFRRRRREGRPTLRLTRPAAPRTDPVLTDLDQVLAHTRELEQRGDYVGAVAVCERGVELAQSQGDAEGAERMRCNRAGNLVALGRGGEVAGELRRILMASRSDVTRFLAASSLSYHHDCLSELDKSRFYARQALDHAERTERPEHFVRAHNRLANLLVAESYFTEASEGYETALRYLDADASLSRALILANLGYCRVMTGRLGEAFGLLFGALRMMRRLRSGPWEVRSRVRLSLAAAYLEVGRPARARRHGEETLAAAQELRDAETVKTTLYLLGEVEKQAGDHLAAYCHFSRLQREYYPDSRNVIDMLMMTSTHKLINLMA